MLLLGSSILLQDCGGVGRGCNSRRTAGRHHDVSGSRHSTNGEEERHRSKSAFGGDSRLHVGYLLRQDGDPDHQPDVGLPGKPHLHSQLVLCDPRVSALALISRLSLKRLRVLK